MFWNIFKLGSSKLKNKMNQAVIANNGLGNTALDYIVKVATGNAVWVNATTTTPVDVLVIVELISGGATKGAPGTGSCLRSLNAIKAALNGTTTAAYRYAYVPPLVTGFHETVGVLYNNKSLTYVNSAAMRNTSNAFLLPRTPLWAQFNVIGANPARVLNIVGIHGPTSVPASLDYKDSVSYTNQLGLVGQLNQAALNPKQDTCIGGDFNCDPLNSYKSGNGSKGAKITAFTDLTGSYGYVITLANGTLTSIRDAMDNTKTPPANYLSEPYDNIVFRLPSQMVNPPVNRVNLIGQAPVFATNAVASFNAARSISDHLPLTIAF